MSTILSEPLARHGLRRGEYVALASLVTATIAMSIDTILPAFEEIEAEYNLDESNLGISLSITVFFVALGFGNLLWGPLADRFGRKPTMFTALAAVATGAIITSFAPTFEVFLLGRVFWGLAAAGPRTIIIAITRDCYDGDAMSRVMSLTLAVFLVVPILAPALGEGLLAIGSWQLTTLAAAALSAIGAIWFSRIEETLRPEDTLKLEFGRLGRTAKVVVTTPSTVLFTIAATMTYGAFFPWLGSSPTLIGDIYGRGSSFALIFGANAVLMAIGILTSERLVRRYSSFPVVASQTLLLIIVSAIYIAVSLSSNGVPAFWLWFAMVTILTALNSSSSPLLQSLAMEPMGAIAGTAASIIGAVVFIFGALIGSIIDSFIETTTTAFGVGFFVGGLIIMATLLAVRSNLETGSAG